MEVGERGSEGLVVDGLAVGGCSPFAVVSLAAVVLTRGESNDDKGSVPVNRWASLPRSATAPASCPGKKDEKR